jgi:hypothetical protein
MTTKTTERPAAERQQNDPQWAAARLRHMAEQNREWAEVHHRLAESLLDTAARIEQAEAEGR